MNRIEPSNVLAVAKKDVRDGIRSKLLLGLIAVFVLVIGGGAALVAREGAEGGGLAGLFGLSFILAVLVLVPVTGLIVSVKSIVRERESGSLNILLSLPYTRSDVLFGKILGRSALLIAAIFSGFLPAAIVLAVSLDDFQLAQFLATVVVTVLFGLIFVAIGVSLSGFVDTETKATIGGIGAFFALYFWDNIFGFVNGRLDVLSADSDLLLFINRFALLTVFTDATRALRGADTIQLFGDLEIDAGSASVVAQGRAQETAAGTLEIPAQPFYLQHWFAFVIAALWIAVPIAIAFYQFNRIDL